MNIIVEVELFPGMVTIVEGVMVRLPEVLLPDQKMPPRLAYCNVSGVPLPPAPPVVEFQTTCTSRMVMGSCGLVTVMLMVLPVIVMRPRVILSHPGTAVRVAVGVKVMVGVSVMVGVRVGVLVGETVGVRLNVGVVGGEVKVMNGPEGVFVAVAVGVLLGGGVVGVLDAAAVTGVDGVVGTGVDPVESSSTRPRIVRALEEVIVREPIGISLSMGLYPALTVMMTRSPVETSSLPSQAGAVTVVPGPESYVIKISASCRFIKYAERLARFLIPGQLL